MSFIIPDDFRGRPLEFMFNGLGHMAGGFILNYVVILLSGLLTALAWTTEIPSKEWIIVIAVLLYLVVIELPQGWRGDDTIEDTLLTMYGSVSMALAFSAVEPYSSYRLLFDPLEAVVVFLIALGHLTAGILWRVRQKKVAAKAVPAKRK